MPSRRRRNRSRSPLRDPPQHHSGNRGYRQRDYYSGDSNGRNGLDNSQSSFYDARGDYGIPDYFYDDPSMEAQRSRGRANDRGRGHHQRGRSRGREHRPDRPQSSNSRRNPMPPPAPRPSRANEDKTKPKVKSAPKNDRPKTIPMENRDKCGACNQDHDIRFCPYPNTDDGRTKICPICNTSKHAWFECWYYKREISEQFNICYENRRCLPVLVHDETIKLVFMNKITLMIDVNKDDSKSSFRKCNAIPGPLSPAFVKTLMPPQATDHGIQKQIAEGRCAPWELERDVLQDCKLRTRKAFCDPSTIQVKIDSIIAGTASTVEIIPIAKTLNYFVELASRNQAKDANFAQISRMPPRTSGRAMKISSIKTSAARKKLRSRLVQPSAMVTECANCDSSEHKVEYCPSPCRNCGRKVAEHGGIDVAGSGCTAGCFCQPHPGHERSDCTRLCRPCVVENKESNTVIKDCTKHCPVHIFRDGRDHSGCEMQVTGCMLCQGQGHHWVQDCPKWLSRTCLIQTCRKFACTAHCPSCGGPNVDEIAALFPGNENTAYRRRVEELVKTWHQFLENRQWDRVANPDASITNGAWSALRCKTHRDIEVDVASLEQKRAATWSAVVDCVRSGLTQKTITRAKALLQVPECEACFRNPDTMNPGS